MFIIFVLKTYVLLYGRNVYLLVSVICHIVFVMQNYQREDSYGNPAILGSLEHNLDYSHVCDLERIT